MVGRVGGGVEGFVGPHPRNVFTVVLILFGCIGAPTEEAYSSSNKPSYSSTRHGRKKNTAAMRSKSSSR